jgi:hypothetical protein
MNDKIELANASAKNSPLEASEEEQYENGFGTRLEKDEASVACCFGEASVSPEELYCKAAS